MIPPRSPGRKSRVPGFLKAVATGAGILGLAGCADLGEPLRPDPATDGGDDGGTGTNGPAVETLLPFRTFRGDTVVVRGAGFGPAPGAVSFAAAGGGRADAAVLAWSETRLRVLVPADAVDGPLQVRVGDTVTPGTGFEIAAPVSFASDVAPLFERYSCTVCHANGSASGNLEVLPYDRLVASTAVVPRASSASRLRQRVLPTTPALERMPEGGPFYLDDDEIRILSDWIDQGARDN